MISTKRLNNLRLQDVHSRIGREQAFCDEILHGRHVYFRFLGELYWLNANPGKNNEDYQKWRDEIKTLAKARRKDLEKRMERVKRIEEALLSKG